MKRLLVATSLVLLASNVAFAGSMQSMSKSQVTQMLKGKTITTIPLVTIDGANVNNTFTGYIDASGKLQGQMANKPDNGPINDTGTWMVKSNGAFCATWQNWNGGKPICTSVYKLNNSLVFVNEKTHMLETIVLDSNIKDGNKVS